MKKVLSLLIAVVLVFSMATVAFAGNLGYTYTCKVCGGTTTDDVEYNTHITNGGCGTCAHCGQGFSAAMIENHQYNVCLDFAGKATCDYCGAASDSTEAAFDSHVEACKAKYFNIPLAKIIAAVKDLVAKIDFEKVIGTVKDLIGKIDLSSIKLPA